MADPIKKIKLLWEQDKPIQAMKIAKESLKLAHTKHGENSYPACAIQELLASMQSRRALYKEASILNTLLSEILF